jgi:peptidoglycan/LPS O-acetylase OafA/YrhL
MHYRKEIDGLRAIAVIVVMLFHTGFQFISGGFLGVDIFFVISGFIMMYIHGNDFQRKNISINFLKKRIIRVIPLYWFLTAAAAVLLFIVPSIFGGGKIFQIKHVLSSFLFIPYNNSIGLPIPIIGPGWSLNYEMYFYLIFSMLLLFPKKYFLKSITGFFLISILCSLFSVENEIIKMITNPMLLEFLFGIYIAKLYDLKRLPNFILLIGMATILFFTNIIIHFNIDYRIFFYGINASFIVMGLLAYEQNIGFKKPNKILLFLAKISYSLYLSHVFSYKLVLKIIPSKITISHPDLVIVFTICCSILIAYLINIAMEKPITRMAKKILINKRILK